MPWKETVVLDERVRFALACKDELESMSVLCRQFGISRRTGYKWLERYEQFGPAGLSDRSRAPLTQPNRVGADLRQQIAVMRRSHPTWGPRKLLAVLEREQPLEVWPAVSTIGQILKSEGLSVPRLRRPRCVLGSTRWGRVWRPTGCGAPTSRVGLGPATGAAATR
jgi:transposase